MSITLKESNPIFTGCYPITFDIIEAHKDIVEEQALAIHKRFPDRNYDVIYSHCEIGVCTELCIVTALRLAGFDAKRNPAKFDRTDPLTFAFDVIAEKNGKTYRFEVKSEKYNPNPLVYFSFNLNPKDGGRDLHTFLNHGVDLTDFLILVAYEETEHGYDMYPEIIFDSKQFKQHVKMSHGGKYSHYVEVTKMIGEGHAILVE